MKFLENKFQDINVRMLLITENELWFVAKDIATALEYPTSSISQIKNLIANVPEEWKGLKPIKTLGGSQNMVVLSEQGLYFFIGRSDKQKALPFQKWIAGEVLPSIRKTGNYSITQKQTPIFDTSSFSNEKLLDVQKTLLGLETAIKILKVSEASKLLMTETIYRELGIKTEFLPKYSDEQHTYSLTHLLKKFGSNISAQKVNQKLLEIGILEIKTRKSHKKEKISQMLLELEFNNIDENIKSETIREFKSLTEKGLKFGKNLINPNNELQTQPHYFESSFAELLNLI
jgi:prophage antirepressor-like protein